ncbi:MAG TPA: Asp-tRNA(Asn)/Glu-tRNA(Gln) amidotransferase subunit GatC [Clostridiaceae bacterium]|nr:Asp-tRNA(Asn)/Glu-tRNA(Gln) amidotransferase subunit GatC [Clostridiaceae bacterium]
MFTKEDLLRVAKLAMIYIEDDELESYAMDVNKLVEFADKIKNVPEDGLEDFDDINDIVNSFNEDEVAESTDRELILRERDGGEDGYFVIRKRVAK